MYCIYSPELGWEANTRSGRLRSVGSHLFSQLGRLPTLILLCLASFSNIAGYKPQSNMGNYRLGK